ncbi:MAG: hypothetical protein A3J06_03150 [Candidatus Moranbacteria bacterium RIFCSPLOWO2_02_FULL_48_19]|nr:MAG: hypothetical protein A3J06_03150 [Candidatus Moranbacteria bacterium RIFCSPLOWO2_02_FULL_48_19]OGI29925.1 MAG: hypothetical protein A3G09_04910 [Candidatus Moranbacteria bacterium RIFCSPLOWO2_12_FULL_48_12]
MTDVLTGEIPSFIKPENYSYIGYYKGLPFSLWFWTAWYSNELAQKIGLDLEVQDYGFCYFSGGHTAFSKDNIRQTQSFLQKKIDDADVAYFDHIVRYADEEFRSGIRFTDALANREKPLSESLTAAIEQAKRLMFYWALGWMFSESFGSILKAQADKSGIPDDRIAGCIIQPVTPLVDQKMEAKKLKGILKRNGLWQDKPKKIPQMIETIGGSPKMIKIFGDHIKKYEWIQILNWVGEKFSLEKLLEQMIYLKEEERGKVFFPVPSSFEKTAKIAGCIAYLRQAGAEYSSMFENKVLPFLSSFAKKNSVSDRELLHLVPEELFEGDNISPQARKKIKKRKNDNWFMYFDLDSRVRIIDDRDIVQALNKNFLPNYEKDTAVIHGQTGNKGKARGSARIILATDDFYKMQIGDILVTPMTTPDFVLLMHKAGAIVTDMGGILCHAAIISREINKPCVIGTKIATQILKDGDLVEVDAEQGIVKILKRSKKEK